MAKIYCLALLSLLQFIEQSCVSRYNKIMDTLQIKNGATLDIHFLLHQMYSDSQYGKGHFVS